jgi:hypothetical protein
VHQDLVNEAVLQALAGNVSAENLEVLAVCGFPGRGNGRFDVTREEGDCRALRVSWAVDG